MKYGDIYLIDSATTHTILQDSRFFLNLKLAEANVNTISGTSSLIEGSGKASIILSNGTTIHLENALYFSKS